MHKRGARLHERLFCIFYEMDSKYQILSFAHITVAGVVHGFGCVVLVFLGSHVAE